MNNSSIEGAKSRSRSRNYDMGLTSKMVKREEQRRESEGVKQ
jgi:hypothetical protein